MIRHRLVGNNLACRRPAKGPILKTRYRLERLQWATNQRNLCHQQLGTSSSLTKSLTVIRPLIVERECGVDEENSIPTIV
jgi:hypothetical protein